MSEREIEITLPFETDAIGSHVDNAAMIMRFHAFLELGVWGVLAALADDVGFLLDMAEALHRHPNEQAQRAGANFLCEIAGFAAGKVSNEQA